MEEGILWVKAKSFLHVIVSLSAAQFWIFLSLAVPHLALNAREGAPSHPTNLSDLSEHIRVEFLPKNTTSLIQPMDQGVISTFKAYFIIRRVFLSAIDAATGDDSISLQEFWR